MTTCFTSLAVLSWKHDISPGRTQPNFHNSTDGNGISFIYIKPWARINSYLVGIITGYILFEMSRKQWKIPKWGALIGWCYATATGIGLVYGLYRTTQGDYQTQPQAVFYQTVSRTLWSSAVAWVAFACAIGKGGPVNSILGWSAFAPLAKLTYTAYLLHPILIYVYYMSAVTPFLHYNDYNMVYNYLGTLVLTYAAAYIMSVCAEAPFMALEKLILPTRGSPPPDKTQSSETSKLLKD
ncbi:nose resistant to fluoxetine protein 6-like [Amphiura filiformis]|uniref:nose resistant to fluoxetine protein 6-like n=1 Tax=Amphiura filiformis TaxID=82378 RepID=UPI003B2114A4